MAFLDRRAGRIARRLPFTAKRHTAGMRTQPERVVLDVRDGVAPSGQLPVRIFVGTEPAQYRAERVLLWSIEQVRDPARVYEIYLMKDLAGFDRRGWLTGFTNYRFAIPHLAGGSGRAIYNDVDQIYLADPGELFDIDLNPYGFLALSDRDTSVMVMDCARMAAVWHLEAAQRERRKSMEAKVRSVADLWGPLEPVWHARDAEYVPGHSKLLHYTAIHMQPWRPSPQRYAYQRNPVEHVWFDLERAADAAGYQVFCAARPSTGYHALLARIGAAPAARLDTDSDALRELITTCKPQTLYHCRLGTDNGAAQELNALFGMQVGQAVTSGEVAALATGELSQKRFDGMVCSGVLEYVPDEDVSWVLELLFRHSKRFVYATAAYGPQAWVLPDGTPLRPRRRDQFWWKARFEAVSARYPAIDWQLAWSSRTVWGRKVAYVRSARRCLASTPVVWVLTDGHPGNTTQSVGLVQALGLSHEVKDLSFTPFLRLHDVLLGAWGASRLGLDKARSAALAPPWPDLIIATGWRTAHVARWIRKQSRGTTRLVQLGRKGGHIADHFDVVISCSYFHLPPHPRRIEIAAPLTQITPERLRQAAAPWRGLFDSAAEPRIALLVGGTSRFFELDTATAQRLGEAVRDFALAVGGTVFATTSPRTGATAAEALRKGLGSVSYLHQWQPGQQDNPYLAYLALADVLVVTGDSESMLAEAVATGKPVYIYGLPQRQPNLRARFRSWVFARAQRPRLNQRGTIRPQQGLEYLCARLIERGMVLPPNDLNALHQTLVQRHMAHFFGTPLDTNQRPVLQEIDDVVCRVRQMIGLRNGQRTANAATGH